MHRTKIQFTSAEVIYRWRYIKVRKRNTSAKRKKRITLLKRRMRVYCQYCQDEYGMWNVERRAIHPSKKKGTHRA